MADSTGPVSDPSPLPRAHRRNGVPRRCLWVAVVLVALTLPAAPALAQPMDPDEETVDLANLDAARDALLEGKCRLASQHLGRITGDLRAQDSYLYYKGKTHECAGQLEAALLHYDRMNHRGDKLLRHMAVLQGEICKKDCSEPDAECVDRVNDACEEDDADPAGCTEETIVEACVGVCIKKCLRSEFGT